MALKKQRHNIWLTATISDVIKARADAPSKKSTTIEDLIQKGLRWEKEHGDNATLKVAATKPVDLEPIHQELARITTHLVTIQEQQKQAAVVKETHNTIQENANRTIIEATKTANNNIFVMHQRTERMEKYILDKIPSILNSQFLYTIYLYHTFIELQMKNKVLTQNEIDKIKKIVEETYDTKSIPPIREKPEEIKKS